MAKSDDAQPMTEHSDRFEAEFRDFLKKWCPDDYAHLIDSDENDGQRLRDAHTAATRAAEDKARREGRKQLYDLMPDIDEAWRMYHGDQNYREFADSYLDALTHDVTSKAGEGEVMGAFLEIAAGATIGVLVGFWWGAGTKVLLRYIGRDV